MLHRMILTALLNAYYSGAYKRLRQPDLIRKARQFLQLASLRSGKEEVGVTMRKTAPRMPKELLNLPSPLLDLLLPPYNLCLLLTR